MQIREKRELVVESLKLPKDSLLGASIITVTGENDIYKFEYCSRNEDVYKIASFIPLEWEAEKPVKVLWVSMDVSQEKKAAYDFLLY